MKVRDVIRLVENDGWRHVRTKGSHRQFQHSVKSGTVTIAGKLGEEADEVWFTLATVCALDGHIKEIEKVIAESHSDRVRAILCSGLVNGFQEKSDRKHGQNGLLDRKQGQIANRVRTVY